MSVIPPLILGGASLVAFVAAFYNAPTRMDTEAALREKFMIMLESLVTVDIDLSNSLLHRLYSQIDIIASHLSKLYWDGHGDPNSLGIAELKEIVRAAADTRSVVEDLLQDSRLLNTETNSATRAGVDFNGVVGSTAIRAWILGGMKADADAPVVEDKRRRAEAAVANLKKDKTAMHIRRLRHEVDSLEANVKSETNRLLAVKGQKGEAWRISNDELSKKQSVLDSKRRRLARLVVQR